MTGFDLNFGSIRLRHARSATRLRGAKLRLMHRPMPFPLAYLTTVKRNLTCVNASLDFAESDLRALTDWLAPAWRKAELGFDPRQLFPLAYLSLPSGRVACCQLWFTPLDPTPWIRVASLAESDLQPFDFHPFRAARHFPSLPGPDAKTLADWPTHGTFVDWTNQQTSQLAFDLDTIRAAGVALACLTKSAPLATILPATDWSILDTILELLPRRARSEIRFSDWPLSEEAPECQLIPVLHEDRLTNHRGVRSYLDLSEPLESIPQLRWSWGRLVVDEVAQGGLVRLRRLLDETPADLTLQHLDAWAEQHRAGLAKTVPTTAVENNDQSDVALELLRLIGNPNSADDDDAVELLEEQTLERLDLLDEAAFNAITGGPDAVEFLRELWPKLREELSPGLFEESRKQYAREVVERCQSQLKRSPNFDPTQSLELLMILLN